MFEIRTKLISSEVKVDPAPSKVSYAIQRVWLRKSFRFSILVIFPILGLVLLSALTIKKYGLDLLIKENVDRAVEIVTLSPVFKIVNLSIISDNPVVIEKIKSNLDFNFPVSSLDIDVEVLKTQIEKIKLVKSASVRLISNGLIEVVVETRKPVVVHRTGNKFLLLDSNGFEVDEVSSRIQRLDLPLIVGEGAELMVDEALNLLIETKSLIARVRGLVRIGERRWDVILDRNQIIKLPEEYPIEAMRKIVSLQEGRMLLDRDILYIDFRNISRPILGLTEDSSKELNEIRNLVRGENV